MLHFGRKPRDVKALGHLIVSLIDLPWLLGFAWAHEFLPLLILLLDLMHRLDADV